MDPFFTSAAKPNYPWEKTRKRVAFAKAVQFKINTCMLGKEKRAKAIKRLERADHRERGRIHGMKHSVTTVAPANHHRSIVGFKQPRRYWHHRDSQHPGYA